MDRKDKEVQRNKFRSLLGFKENDIFQSKEYSIILKIRKAFPNEIIRDQYKVLKHRIDLVFPAHKLGIEIDENGNMNRIKINKQERQELIFEVIRINPDKENFDIFDEIGKI